MYHKFIYDDRKPNKPISAARHSDSQREAYGGDQG